MICGIDNYPALLGRFFEGGKMTEKEPIRLNRRMLLKLGAGIVGAGGAAMAATKCNFEKVKEQLLGLGKEKISRQEAENLVETRMLAEVDIRVRTKGQSENLPPEEYMEVLLAWIEIREGAVKKVQEGMSPWSSSLFSKEEESDSNSGEIKL